MECKVESEPGKRTESDSLPGTTPRPTQLNLGQTATQYQIRDLPTPMASSVLAFACLGEPFLFPTRVLPTCFTDPLLLPCIETGPTPSQLKLTVNPSLGFVRTRYRTGALRGDSGLLSPKLEEGAFESLTCSFCSRLPQRLLTRKKMRQLQTLDGLVVLDATEDRHLYDLVVEKTRSLRHQAPGSLDHNASNTFYNALRSIQNSVSAAKTWARHDPAVAANLDAAWQDWQSRFYGAFKKHGNPKANLDLDDSPHDPRPYLVAMLHESANEIRTHMYTSRELERAPDIVAGLVSRPHQAN